MGCAPPRNPCRVIGAVGAHSARAPHIGFLAQNLRSYRGLRGYRCRRVEGGAPHQMYLVRGAGASATAPIAAELLVDEAACAADQLNVAGLNVCGDHLRDFLRELVDGVELAGGLAALLNSTGV